MTMLQSTINGIGKRQMLVAFSAVLSARCDTFSGIYLKENPYFSLLIERKQQSGATNTHVERHDKAVTFWRLVSKPGVFLFLGWRVVYFATQI